MLDLAFGHNARWRRECSAGNTESFDIDMSSAPAEETQPVQENVQQEPEQSEPIAEEQTTTDRRTCWRKFFKSGNTRYEPVALDESSVSRYVSEKLGVEIESMRVVSVMQQLQQQSQQHRLMSVLSNLDFVQQTGRNPEDWFKYQSLNTSEMDDMTAVRVSMSNEYPNLSGDDIDNFGSKYKLDEDYHSEDEIKLSKYSRIDADKARQGIEQIRGQFALQHLDKQEVQSPIDENWIRSMQEQRTTEAVTLELADGKEFEFSINDSHRNQLIDKNSNIESFFDQYISQDDNGTTTSSTFIRPLLITLMRLLNLCINKA